MMSMDAKSIPAGEFKQRCLAILDEVAKSHQEVVVTKRGKPVARLVPVISDEEREADILASLRGRGKVLVSEEEFLRPSSSDVDWQTGKTD
jgi:prevent-host-death family protein